MTEHLYYRDSFLYEFDAEVRAVVAGESGSAVILDRTAFYPTSGGQVFDTGWLVSGENKLRVREVTEQDDGTILHRLEGEANLTAGSRVRGLIDADRRRDHMQQHSGQHVLSAAFVSTLNMPTVSFHMGEDACSIDLDTKTLSTQQAEMAEALANEVVTENRCVGIRFVSREEAMKLGLRKLPPAERDELRLIDIHDFDLTACGGTHVSATGQIGAILLRKIENVRQGWRVEFVCGKRAVQTARRDYGTLAESSALLSTHVWDVPQQIRKTQEELRGLKKAGEQMATEVADLMAARILAETTENGGRRVVVRMFAERDAVFLKLLAQRLVRQGPNVIALLGCGTETPALVFAQSAGQSFDMGALMKQALAKLGGRGGGSKDMAQGGLEQATGVKEELGRIAAVLES